MEDQKNSTKEKNGVTNLSFEDEENGCKISKNIQTLSISEKEEEVKKGNEVERPQWDNGLEFLMSCIAMSVGLGNIWRFPFTAFENGGGAFLIPYIIVLVVVGRPLYYMEMAMGQFTSQGSVNVWELAPALRGVGYAQLVSTSFIVTYYCSLMALTLYYFFASFTSVLPWSDCLPEWTDCFDSSPQNGSILSNQSGLKSSSEYYFVDTVLHETENIDDGIGLPDWKLSLCLFTSWLAIFLTIMRGVKSTGKAAYFLALFPYVVLVGLLIRGVTLPGAVNGIIFFVKPQWEELLNPKVWYAAVTQAFFSLGVSFGALITYSSYNNFNQNIHRDALIVTTLDTFTSLIAGITIFGILGNLAHESGTTDVASIVKGGTGLAFISYPDAIAKFNIVPQFFSVLFFFMLYVLGIGSAISLQGNIITVITDQCPNIKYWKVSLATCSTGFLVGLVYVTPGGQFILNLVDYNAGSFIVFVTASTEVIGIVWIYGLDNFCKDLEFMLNIKIGIYWRLCWGLFTPVLLIVILIYSLAIASPLTYKDTYYPNSAYAMGWLISAFGLAQLPFWGVFAYCKHRHLTFWEMIKASYRPSAAWGPQDPSTKKEWEQYKKKWREELNPDETVAQHLSRVLLGR